MIPVRWLLLPEAPNFNSDQMVGASSSTELNTGVHEPPSCLKASTVPTPTTTLLL